MIPPSKNCITALPVSTRLSLIKGKVLEIVLPVPFLMATVHLAEAQQRKKVPRIGFLGAYLPSSNPARTEAFRQGLRELGYVEGKNIIIEYRWSEGKAERLSQLAVELVSLQPDVIVTQSPPGVLAAKKATATISIVFTGIGDPVAVGVVTSLARPSGNVTGLSNVSQDLGGKRLELLRESFPKIASVAVFWNPLNPGNAVILKETKIAAQSLGLKLQPLEVRGPNDFDSAFQATTSRGAKALFPFPDPLFTTHIRRIVEFAAKKRLPAMYPNAEFVEFGGLMSYAPNIPEQFRRAATYVDKILKGTKPEDLPVERPMKFEFVINLKTAKQIGLTIPQWVLMQANEVIK